MNAPQRLLNQTSRTIFIRDLLIPAMIGIHSHEKQASQMVCINVEMVTDDQGEPLNDDFAKTVCYESAVNGIKKIISTGHINLVETMADEIAAFCLQDRRVVSVRIMVEKPDIMEDAAGVGVEIERFQMLPLNLPETG